METRLEGLADDALVERARAGEVAAFGALVDRHRAAVYALAVRLIGAPEEAEEAAQDAFVRAWRGLGGYRGEAAFGTWLHRIATRVALDRRRALIQRRRVETAVEEALERADPAAGADPAGTAARGATRRRLAALLDRLGDSQRAAVVLYYLEDRPVGEVAQALDLPENTVKIHLARARAALRGAWQRDEARAARAGHEAEER